MAVVQAKNGFTPEVFARLGRASTQGDAITSVERLVDPLLTKLNRSMWASRFSVMRNQFGLNGGDAFLTSGNYIHGDCGHWYVFHRGGRWEPQFNVGMFGTRADHPAYMRVGIGFNLTLASIDPGREAGLRSARSFFGNLRWLARSPKRRLVASALASGRPLVECVGAPPEASGDPERIIRWAASVDPDLVRWVFLGRILSPEVPEEAEVLADRGELLFELTRTLDAWLPVWATTMRGME